MMKLKDGFIFTHYMMNDLTYENDYSIYFDVRDENGCTYYADEENPFDPNNAANWDGDQQIGFR